MSTLNPLQWLRSAALRLVALMAVLPLIASPLLAQDNDAAAQEDKEQDAEAKEQEKAPDPFAVPDGTPEELKQFVMKMARFRPNAETREEMIEQHTNRLRAVIEATERILAAEPDEELMVFAYENQFGALESLVRYDEEQADRLAELSAKLETHTLPALARLPAASNLRQAVSGARSMSPEELEGLAEQVLAFVEEYGIDPVGVSLASTVGRYMGYAGATESGAAFYERMAALMEKSDDPTIADRAAKMVGAARMLRLPGKPIEVFGTTASGEKLNWEDYRGKVVLVDFWASWCGPCLAELPNMKRNLSRYGDKGFAILGVNLDQRREAFEKCIEEKDITWSNLLADSGEDAGWQHPMATYYGISAIPTAILVNKEGNVVSLRARGSELDRLLEDLLGPVEESAEDESTSDDSDSADQN